ncbi:GIY-YIG nuclease family protein [Spirosoma agri]|uniref:GIY-YIG nuclease family protein n=1 Tax=Spirosoma agri TaxID=1987381 RepID=A0A6M0ILQ8_9BACT|nr:GIY-YIG nuclease family protein [Spirosoma agri]NEU68341.1 GIY-YIG nuclease family protein [Spirosoma agri]
MRTYFIYILSDPRDNRVRYVGCTLNPKSRLISHISGKSGFKRAEWIDELKVCNLIPTLTVVSTSHEKQAAVLEEIRVYKLYDPSDLVCENPERFKYSQASSKYEKAKGLLATSQTDILDFLKSTRWLNIDWVANQMWPNNKSANTYLSRKLSGERPFTRKDALLAKDVLNKLGVTLTELSVADVYK